MSAGLKDLLETIRQHPCFQEFLSGVVAPEMKPFRPAKSGETEQQQAEWIYRSGRLAQHERWREYLTGYQPSEQEKS